jgi:hypothetical protein
MAQAFWIPEGNDIFRATIHTQGPWNPQFQHGGPPGALLVRQIERCSPRPDMLLGRISVDILGPIPIAPLHAYAQRVRPGRSVELLEAFLEYEGRPVMHASAWRIRLPSDAVPTTEEETVPALPPRETNSTIAAEWDCGFLAATEWRFVHGHYTQAGAATTWIRLRYPLIADEETSPAQRLIAAADSVNGVSSPLDIRSWQFVPPELTVHMLRAPSGEWICLDARTHLQSGGIGLATASLYDERGLVGRSGQTLLISQRVQEK